LDDWKTQQQSFDGDVMARQPTFAPILVIFNDSGNAPGPGSVALLVVKELLPLLVLVWVVAVIITVVRENRRPKKSLPNTEP
jgi:hypothetical protein